MIAERSLAAFFFCIGTSPLALSTAIAQERATQDDTEVTAEAEAAGDRDIIVVDGVRRRGITLSNVEPELTLTEADIEAYGVSSIAELLEQLAPETSSGRSRRGSGGRPVVLLNGRRISGFREIGRYPPEALARVEILPEEAALAYGFNADQRVINFILKPNVIVRAAEGQVQTRQAGGNATTQASLQRLSVDGSKRFSIDLSYETQSELLESERDFISEQPALPFAYPGNLGADNFGDPIGAQLGGDPAFTVAALQDNSFNLPLVGSRNPEDDQSQRTLQPEREQLVLGFSRASGFAWDSVLTLTGELERSEATQKLGLGDIALDLPGTNPFVPFGDGLTLYTQVPSDGPLLQENDTDVLSGGIAVVSKPSRTNWTFTANYEVSDNETVTDLSLDTAQLQAAVDGGADPFAALGTAVFTREQRITESETRTGEAEFVVNAKTFALPAGDLQVSAQAGLFSRELDTRVVDSAGETESALSRETVRGQLSVDVPLVDAVDGWVGRLAVNGNINARDLSDFGTLTSWGGGFNWRPSERFRLLASYTREEGAPGIAQLGDPVLVTPNVRVFDFTTGETLLVDAITGGNPALVADSRDVSKVGVQIKPWEEREVTLNIDYTQSFLEDEARAFPALTAEIETAFPDRFTRDASGTLIAIDQRPVNFEEGNNRQLRTALNWSKRLGGRGGRPGGGRPQGAGGPPGGRPQAASRPEGAEGQSQQTQGGPPQAARGGRPEAGSAQQAEGGRRQSNRQPTRSGRPGRVSLGITHVWTLEDTLLVRDGLPELDLLGGSAIGPNGGTSEHELNVVYRRWNKGLGLFARAQWKSGTKVDGALAGGSDLEFSDLLIVNTRITYDLGFSGAIMQKAPWLRDTRVAMSVNNALNQIQDVRDDTGSIPLRYQPDLIDPNGRIIEFEIRKRF
ncbi:TonB-dependent receptor [Parvularcula lutaonensis]|uniref:TonB-dependent receptor n=1 Tax=Parvularcula lutaonensis TaxID=491923 RepID=A0ABV7M7I6_9PROT|nr:TonB-dependent receptor plug domain-containing protein [Parvularcula lutaonensis]GGY41970.1 TonB-dependent receptor [Parvularcula lutaonensis]